MVGAFLRFGTITPKIHTIIKENNLFMRYNN